MGAGMSMGAPSLTGTSDWYWKEQSQPSATPKVKKAKPKKKRSKKKSSHKGKKRVVMYI